MKRSLAIILLAVPSTIFIYATGALYLAHKSNGTEFSYENGGTDLTFISSDLGWQAEENLITGRDYSEILAEFEKYKSNCNNPNIYLLRTKPKKKPWKWAWWFDNYDSPKWKVPYLEPAQIEKMREESVKCE